MRTTKIMGQFLSKFLLSSNDNLETFTLIWLDASIDQSAENIQTQKTLAETIHQLKPFDNAESCRKYIEDMSDQDRIVLITSGQLGRTIVSRIHSLEQLLSIYVFCGDKKANEQWATQYSKIKAVVTDYKELIARIKFDHEKRQENRIYEPLSISIFDSKRASEKLTTDLQGNLLHSQLLINSLLRMNTNKTDKAELVRNIKKIYQRDSHEMEIIDKFDRTYKYEDAIEWYTRDCFLSRLLNKALQTQNIDVLFLFQFFIHDIGHLLAHHRCSSSITAYRSQLITKNELKKLQNASGQFISINSFISAATNRGRVLKILDKDDELEKVLFSIEADPKNAGKKPFGLIRPYGENTEKEVLFMLGSIFEVLQVSQREKIWQVSLRLCSDTNLQLDSINEDDNTKLLLFGNVLLSMGKIEEAEIYYQRLREQLLPNTSEFARCLEALASIAKDKGEYEASIKLYNDALKINRDKASMQGIDLASNYIGLGEAYQKTNDPSKAEQYFKRALEALGENPAGEGRVKQARCFNNIGILYQEQKNYKEALQNYLRTYEIRQKIYPPDEVAVGMALNNIGNSYYLLQLPDALYYYEEALKLYKKKLPPQHEKIASVYNNIGAFYDDQGKAEEALNFYNDALRIYLAIYSPHDPKVIKINENIKRIKPEK